MGTIYRIVHDTCTCISLIAINKRLVYIHVLHNEVQANLKPDFQGTQLISNNHFKVLEIFNKQV